MNKNELRGFHIVGHTHCLSKSGGSRVGYHCPDCGCFYAEGNYTIENATYVLGNAEPKKCCGKVRPTPRLFETLDEVRDFMANLENSGEWERATLIRKSTLMSAHFNQKLVAEQKRKIAN
ncbi:MAG: hypothetical protein A2942_02665 [Candidatus Lloydbacteria bacterium RIFCSPLOWO2_01_FULL_50_20]|uniref:Uncharacterized protein n=1 Tax=Candidatus Lloydbacteria bacterium RIFCSPLOWO2_01_FULL_50_20 TaxID=1798665 RepID=A0A1G2DF36_9BACT|nr:MAG: hypothetical protein A3C13_04780 [Candidatus Lloydbacteria bacterium RIFCSPHIGHO2_02_FULL_50_11]OGZ12255.1 MAG: hypothetical protein A2942_02665 [Candidatus Lloydbacteria bacterium RIFCSPLOWO2_01_FULL_50_20]